MDPYLQDFNFCIFWQSWHHTIIFCWNFDWDLKSNLGPALEQCELSVCNHSYLLLQCMKLTALYSICK